MGEWVTAICTEYEYVIIVQLCQTVLLSANSLSVYLRCQLYQRLLLDFAVSVDMIAVIFLHVLAFPSRTSCLVIIVQLCQTVSLSACSDRKKKYDFCTFFPVSDFVLE